MIPKENIVEITELFKRKFWMVNILFAIYFESSMYHVNQMKSDIDDIQFIVNNDTRKRFDSLISNLDQYSFLRKNRYQIDNLFEPVKASISYIRWKGIETSNNWKSEIDKIIALNTGLLKGSMSYNDNEQTLIEVDQHLLNIGEKYPKLRKYVSYSVAESIVNVFVGIILSTSVACYWKHFDPVLQRFGSNYFVYPNTINYYYFIRQAEIKVNGNRIWDNKYEFYPQRKGMHWLDIEYTFWGNGRLCTFESRKGLMVK